MDAADGEDALAERRDGLTRVGAVGRLGLGKGADPPAIANYGAAVRGAVEETGLWPGVMGGRVGAGGGGGRAGGGAAGRGASESAAGRAREALLGGTARFAEVLKAAKAAPGASAVHDEREMTGAVWLTPRAALARHRRRQLPMIFPTIRTLEDLSAFATVEDLLAYYRGRPIPRVRPEIVRTATGVALRVGVLTSPRAAPV